MFFVRLAIIALVYLVIKFVFKQFARLFFSSRRTKYPNINTKKNSIYTDIKDAEFEEIE